VTQGTSSGVCTTTVSTASQVASAVSSAPGGAVVCLQPCTYTGLTLSGAHSSDVTVEPNPSLDPNGSGKVTLTDTSGPTDGHGNTNAVYFPTGTTHIVLRGFYVQGQVEVGSGIGTGASYITIDQNDITGGNDGVYIFGEDCTVPHAVTWSGCSGSRYGPVTNVTISGNRIHGWNRTNDDDAININNYENVTISGNEITNVVEQGSHNDTFQSTFGGENLVFTRNYVHDNQSDFLIKDGDVLNFTMSDNLFVRGNINNGGEAYPDVFDTHNFIMENNTIATDGGAVRTGNNSPPSSCAGIPYCSTTPYNAIVDHNMVGNFSNGTPSDKVSQFDESYNIFGGSPFTFSPSPTDQIRAGGPFKCGADCANGTPAGDDYELASNPNKIGIDWSPAAQHYGP
jgi:hypothetical protein